MTARLDDDTLLARCLSGATQRQIAEEFGMSQAQICRRVNTAEFQDILSAYRKKIFDSVMTDLSASSQKAVKVLDELLEDKNPFVRFNAATRILSLSQDFHIQSDLMQEINEIKKAQISLSEMTGGMV